MPIPERYVCMARTKKKRKRTARMKQEEFDFSTKSWGGYRAGSGAKKKPKGEAGVSHAKREVMTKDDCALITMKLRSGLPSMRQIEEDRLLRAALRDGRKEGFRIIHYVMMSNHLHLLVEATDLRVAVTGTPPPARDYATMTWHASRSSARSSVGDSL